MQIIELRLVASEAFSPVSPRKVPLASMRLNPAFTLPGKGRRNLAVAGRKLSFGPWF